jgi:LmbE family N-acetylglucosaminyl deacetylase
VKILAIGAHPDDIELGCGATLALFKQNGHQVYMLILTKGECSGDPKVREKECKKAAKILGVDKLMFGSLKDTRITDGPETIMEIESVVKTLKPDMVFAHSFKDGHQDHRNTGMAALSAARNSNKVLLYESPAALRDFCPQVFVDVASTFDIKLKALKAFGSQADKVYFNHNNNGNGNHSRMSDSRLPQVSYAAGGLAQFRGYQAGVELAEAFEVGKFLLEIEKNHKE